MKNAVRRLCERKLFDKSFSFKMSIIEASVENVKQNSTGVDISSYGLGMKTKHSLQEGSVLELYFPMREMEITVPVYAQVMWSKPDDDYFRVGLRFLE